jgi:hypothetical protein
VVTLEALGSAGHAFSQRCAARSRTRASGGATASFSTASRCSYRPRSEQRLARLPGVVGVYPSVRYHRTLFRSPFVIGAHRCGARISRPRARASRSGSSTTESTRRTGSSRRRATRFHRIPKGERRVHDRQGDRRPLVPASGTEEPLREAAVRPVESEHGTHVAGIAAGDHGTSAPGQAGP